MQIQILPFAPSIFEGVSAKTGKPFRIVKQSCIVKKADGSGFASTIQPPRGKEPYAAGTYALESDAFDGKDGLTFAPKLVAVSAPGAK